MIINTILATPHSVIKNLQLNRNPLLPRPPASSTTSSHQHITRQLPVITNTIPTWKPDTARPTADTVPKYTQPVHFSFPSTRLQQHIHSIHTCLLIPIVTYTDIFLNLITDQARFISFITKPPIQFIHSYHKKLSLQQCLRTRQPHSCIAVMVKHAVSHSDNFNNYLHHNSAFISFTSKIYIFQDHL